jgi:hypothetical protein
LPAWWQGQYQGRCLPLGSIYGGTKPFSPGMWSHGTVYFDDSEQGSAGSSNSKGSVNAGQTKSDNWLQLC